MSSTNLNAIAINAQASPGSSDGVRGAIARAAQATGVDFSYLLAQARLESSLDASAHAATSSAAGLYQFTKGTWSTMLARHGAALGLGEQAGGLAPAPGAARAQLQSLRYDPDAAAMMAAELAGDNTTALTAALGRAPTSSELYLAHFLGAAGATRFLTALAADPGQSAAALLPKPAAANRAVFFDATGAPRSLVAVMGLLQTRLAAAMQDTGDPEPDFTLAPALGGSVTASGLPPIAEQFATAQADGSLAAGATEPSMADTLRDTFALASTATAPAFVRTAYGRMQALGL